MTTKPEKKVLYASYESGLIFKIPDGLDLEDKTQVTSYYVKYGVLYITLPDGTEIEIQYSMESGDLSRKQPSDTQIEDASNWFNSDDEDEEDEKEQEVAVRTYIN